MGSLLDVEALRSLVLRSGSLCAIDGCGGSGKSTLARQVAATGDIAVVEVDDFYLPSERRVAVPATPQENLDLGRLTEQVIAPLAEGRGARYQRYDWEGDVLSSWVDIAPGTPVIVEGTCSTWTAGREWYAVRVWVDAPAVLRLERGVARDGEERRATWVGGWMPAEARYVEAEDPASHAHLVVDGSGTDGGTSAFVVLRSSLPGI
jgi:uridine kinase